MVMCQLLPAYFKKQQGGGISMKQLPEENEYGNAWQEIWLKASPIFFISVMITLKIA